MLAAVGILSALIFAAALGAVPAESPPPADVPESIYSILARFCLDCHSGPEASGGVDLGAARSPGEIYRQCRSWSKVPRALSDGIMPPEDADQPSEDELWALAGWVDRTIGEEARSAPPNPGRSTIRRLNRVEYNHTLRDLLGLEIDAARELPSDSAGEGFDNQGDVLFMPPVLMEKYMDATKRVLAAAFQNPGSREKILTAAPGEGRSPADAARAILAPFLRRAFRRPPTPLEVQQRIDVFQGALDRGKSFEEALQSALASALLSPHFLFRVEMDQAPEEGDEPYRVADDELAVRLSYFLWASMPDDELFEAADDGRLRDPKGLREQTMRMLADPKAVSLAEDFAAQWFGFRDMRTAEMDIRRYGKFGGLRDAMYGESVAFFDALFRENRSILDILDCDYAFVNDRLAGHYGLPPVEGGRIREVPLSDRRRGGVLGMGSTLVVTSYPTRTSPVLRGKWVLEQLLGTPPPPPPPNVKPLSKDDTVKDGLTLRQRFEKHREDVSCASCHARMDPIGFGLENFDGIGEWRDTDNGLPIDDAASLPGGAAFRGPEGLKDVLLGRKEQFVRHMVEKTMTYALGRAVDFYDENTVRNAMSRLSDKGYRSHELIFAVVESDAFQFRRNSNAKGGTDGR